MRSSLFLAGALSACSPTADDVGLSRRHDAVGRTLRVGQRVPEIAEATAVGPFAERILRGGRGFSGLVRCAPPDVAFKDEERTGADRLMTPRLCDALERLAPLVEKEWPDVRLRVTEAWDERREHAPTSVHYEGRAADLTTSDVDSAKLGRLARLAVDAGFDWVFYEDATHVHVSVKR